MCAMIRIPVGASNDLEIGEGKKSMLLQDGTGSDHYDLNTSYFEKLNYQPGGYVQGVSQSRKIAYKLTTSS